MTKKDILNKIKNAILGEGSTTPGITVTNKTKQTEKKFSDDYYKESNKKFKDYLGLKKDDFDAPKVNADEKQEKTYGGSGMEGLTYDNEGTEVEKKFTKRNKDLNKPSKSYYLKKDEVNDVYGKLTKKSDDYKKDKKKFQNTPPVRAVKAESAMKRLTYKQEFLSENDAFNKIPNDFKQNDLIFEMTDGNKLLKIRWEGGSKGKPVVLLSKDSQKINKELDRMKQLFEYNSRDNFSRSNLLMEEKEFHGIMNKVKGEDENTPVPTTNSTTSNPQDSVGQKLEKQPTSVTGVKDIFYNPKKGEWNFGIGVQKMGESEFIDKLKEVANSFTDKKSFLDSIKSEALRQRTKQRSKPPIPTFLNPNQVEYILNSLNLNNI